MGLVYILFPEGRRSSSGYGGRLDLGGWLGRRSTSSGYGNGAAELEAPGGSGKLGLEEDGVGYLKRSWAWLPAGFGL